VPLRRGGRAHLADFGIARLSQNTFLNTANHAMGTLNYMAPELFGDGAEVDEKCDVYSFGMIAYEMFTGAVPWWGLYNLNSLCPSLERRPVAWLQPLLSLYSEKPVAYKPLLSNATLPLRRGRTRRRCRSR
jgi:serine/threonine protein kinase